MAPFHKTRLAPTPSGFLHAGNAFNFLLTAALARRFGASLLLRVDDLDHLRCRSAYFTDIFDTLDFLQIHCQEGPQDLAGVEAVWSQQRRMPLYNEALERLRSKDKVFACACSRFSLTRCDCQQKKLPLNTHDTCWRLITDDKPILVKGADCISLMARLPADMKNFVVRRKDGLPAYQLASVVDDLHFGIDFIVRGEDLWPSTLAQHYLSAMLEEPAFSDKRFHHHPLLKDAAGEKLSKSAGALSVKHWRESGKSSAELLACLGEWLQSPQPVRCGEDIAKAVGL